MLLNQSYAGDTSYIYDDANRLNQAITNSGDSATYNYDEVGNILSIDRNSSSRRAPSITSVSPATVEAGQSVTVSITGTDLNGATLSINSPDVVLSKVTGTTTSLNALISTYLYTNTGAYTLTASNALGSSSILFTVTQPTPVISSLNPSSGPVSRIVTITGTGFSPVINNNVVTFNGVTASIISTTPTSLEAIVPDGATTGPVVVTVGGLSSLGMNFSVTTSQGTPTISQIFPNVSSVQGGQRVTISGTNFSPDTKVYLGTNQLLSTAVTDSNTIKGVTPVALAGTYDVKLTNVNGDAFLANGFTYLSGAPERIVAINPAMGLINIPINVPIAVAFTRPVNRATITQASFALTDGQNNPVNGVFSFDFNDTVVTFKPSANLAPNATYVLSLTQSITSTDGIPLEGAYTASFQTSTSADTVSPNVTSNIAAGATNIPYNTNVVLTFSEPVNPATINQLTVTVSNNGTQKSGTVMLGQQNTVVTFMPVTPFFPNSPVQVTVSGKITDVAGNALVGSSGAGSDYQFSFTTGTTMDLFPPQVLSINPPPGASDVNRSTSISVTFNKPLNPSSVNDQTFIVASKGITYPGTYLFSNDNKVATYIPSQLLPDFSEVTVTVTTGVSDYAGNALMQPYGSTFTTQSGYDNFRPWITAVSPYNAQDGVPQNARVELAFSERMNPLTINGGTFHLNGPEGLVPATIAVSPDGLKATLTPQKMLLPNSYYNIYYTSGMTDVAGNASLSSGSNSFKTGTTISDTAPLAVLSMTPDNGATGVAINAMVSIQFNKTLDATSVTKDTVIVSAGGVPVVGSIWLDNGNSRIRFRPANLLLLSPNTFYEATVTTGVTDVVGNSLPANYGGSFTTGTTSDTTAPALVSYSPAYNATNVPVDTVITLTFNEPINPSTVNWWSSVRLTGSSIYGNVPTDITISTDRKTVTVTPQSPLFSWKQYNVYINGIEDVSGNVYNNGSLYFKTAVASGTDVNNLPTGATVTANPGSLFADGATTTTITISNINHNNVLVPNGTKVAVTAGALFRQDSAGGTILGGVPSAVDPRIQIFTTLGGSITLTYQSVDRSDLTPGATVCAYVQVLSIDTADRAIDMVGQGQINLFRGSSLSMSANPTSLLANGTSYSAVHVVLTGNDGQPAPAGTRIAVTAAPVYRQDSAGGTINGGTPAQDRRFTIFTAISGGIVDFTYTAPVLAAGQAATAYLQFAEVDDNGLITGSLSYTSINLNGSSGYTAPLPVILTVSPSNGQSGAGLNTPVVASFSQSLDPATVNGNNFYMNGPNGRVTATLTVSDGYNGPNTVVTLTSSAALAPYSTYYVYIGTGIRSVSGNPLYSAYSGGSFSTSGSADTTAPQVTRTNPADGVTDAAVNTAVSVEFNEPMEPSTLNPASFLVSAGGVNLTGRVGVTSGIYGYNTVAYFVPDQLLPGNTTITVMITSAAKDAAGNALTQPYGSTFTTQSGYDNFRPWITAVSPPNGAVDVPTDQTVAVSFSEPINPLSLTSSSFYVNGPGGRVPGTIALTTGNTQAVFTPSVPLFSNSQYSVAVVGITDVAGNSILNNLSSGFRTLFAGTVSPLPTGASVFVNPDSLYANGNISTTIIISNININNTPAPNGTVIAVTAQPTFNQGSVGGVISGNSIGMSVDGRFLLFETYGASVTLYYTPPDLTSMRPGSTSTGVIQVASVDADTRPVSMIGQGYVTLYAIGSATVTASPSVLAANGVNTSTITVTVRDRNGNLVQDGTVVGLTAAPIFIQNSAGGSFIDGTTSPANGQIQLYSTVAGSFTATYQTPPARGSGTAVIQAVTADTSGNPISLITTANIVLQ